jgi:hypothetical protein
MYSVCHVKRYRALPEAEATVTVHFTLLPEALAWAAPGGREGAAGAPLQALEEGATQRQLSALSP